MLFLSENFFALYRNARALGVAIELDLNLQILVPVTSVSKKGILNLDGQINFLAEPRSGSSELRDQLLSLGALSLNRDFLTEVDKQIGYQVFAATFG